MRSLQLGAHCLILKKGRHIALELSDKFLSLRQISWRKLMDAQLSDSFTIRSGDPFSARNTDSPDSCSS